MTIVNCVICIKYIYYLWLKISQARVKNSLTDGSTYEHGRLRKLGSLVVTYIEIYIDVYCCVVMQISFEVCH